MTFRVTDLMLEPVLAANEKANPSPQRKWKCEKAATCHNCSKPSHCPGCTRGQTAPSTCTGNTDEVQCFCPSSETTGLETLQAALREKMRIRKAA